MKKCTVHDQSFLFLKCNHQVCVGGIEEILKKKFEIVCRLMSEKKVDELNKFSFNVGCTSGCFVKNVYAFNYFATNMWNTWTLYQLNNSLWDWIVFLFDGCNLRFKICQCGCGGVLIGEYGCLKGNQSY